MHEQRRKDLGAWARAQREHDRARADEPPRATDPTADALVDEMMPPLSRERAAAILDRVLGSAAPSVGRGRVLPLARPQPAARFGRRMAVAALALAAAVLLILWTARPAPPERVALRGDIHGDSYALTLVDAPGETRGAPLAGFPADDRAVWAVAPLPTFAAGERVALRLRPRDPIRGRISGSIRAVQETRELALAWDLRATSPDGHLEIDGAADDLLTVAAGVWELEVTLFHDGAQDPLWRGHTRLLLTSARAEPR